MPGAARERAGGELLSAAGEGSGTRGCPTGKSPGHPPNIPVPGAERVRRDVRAPRARGRLGALAVKVF